MNEDEFWKHQDTCNICSQHPQSVASFHYETMCPIGRSYTEKQGYFKNYGPPAISGPKIYIQDIAGCSQDYLKQFKEINEQ